jgi:hypothetical protein
MFECWNLKIAILMKEFLDDYKDSNEELTVDDVVKALKQFREWIESDNDDTTEFRRTYVRTIFFS